jgi:hypothetical protein
VAIFDANSDLRPRSGRSLDNIPVEFHGISKLFEMNFPCTRRNTWTLVLKLENLRIFSAYCPKSCWHSNHAATIQTVVQIQYPEKFHFLIRRRTFRGLKPENLKFVPRKPSPERVCLGSVRTVEPSSVLSRPLVPQASKTPTNTSI